MIPLTVAFKLAPFIIEGLVTGKFNRVGGVIREVATERIVAFLKDLVAPNVSPKAAPKSLLDFISPVGTFINIATVTTGFSNINQRLGGFGKQLGAIGETIQETNGIVRLNFAGSILNLGISSIGLAVIAERLNTLEENLKQSQIILNKINRKIDLGFYADFRTGLNLAANALRMEQYENRRSSAIEAISRLIKAQNIYLGLVNQEIEQQSQIINEYLLTLYLAYIAEARCYLELEEFANACHRLEEGSEQLRACTQKYVESLLTSNPAAYLHPQFKGEISLQRLTRIYQWLDPSLDESLVFDSQRDNLFRLFQSPDEWLGSLPPTVIDRETVLSQIPIKVPNAKNPTPLSGRYEKEAYSRLPHVMNILDSVVETNNRFEAYKAEIKAISQLGISFQEWMQLKPMNKQLDGEDLIFIMPAKPIAV